MSRRVAFALVALASIGAARQTPDPLAELFARGKAMQPAMHSVAASFTETTVSSVLRDPLVAKGTLVAALPLRVLMTYESPEVRYVLLDAERMVTAVPARRERHELDIGETWRRIQKYFVDASPDELRKSFEITLDTDPASRDAYRLDMTPKRKQIREGIARLRLWIDRTRLVMRKMRLDYTDGDSRTLELANIKVNVAVDDRTFTIPSGGTSGGQR
jgi:outer membrane lipoprotein-sorting protein